MVRFINSRMSIAGRLWLMVAVSTIPDLLLTAMFVHQSSLDIAFARKEYEGTTYLASLWSPFITTALTGEIGNTSGSEANYNEDFGTQEAARSYEQERRPGARLDLGKALIGSVADGSNLTLDPDLDSFYAMDADTVRLPGIVTAAVALLKAAEDAPDQNTRLVQIAFAVNRLEISANDADASLHAAIKNNAAGVTSKALTGLASDLRRLANDLSARGRALLEGRKPDDLQAAELRLLKQVNVTWTATNTELARLLQIRIASFFQKLYVSLAIAGVSLIVAGWLSRTVSKGLSARVDRLISVMDSLLANDIPSKIPFLDDRNETGRIAKTLVAFRESLIDRMSLKSSKVLADEQAIVVAAVAEGLDQLARGDLTLKLAQPFPPELETIRVDLNMTAEKLRGAMEAIANSALHIRGSAGGISAAAVDLARRTNEQSTTLNKASRAIQEAQANAQVSAATTLDGLDTILSARKEADASQRVLSETVAAMQRIEDSSKQIGTVVAMMDDLARQTNMLALNASIEAARAGEAGRGFAVVAGEVRELAQRSTEGTRQVKRLISSSGEQIISGVSLVQDMGEALRRISTQVETASNAMNGIAINASYQAERLVEIDKAVTGLDRVTSANKTIIAGAAAASICLRDEAETLNKLLGGFTVAQDQKIHPSKHAA